jgi:hypothetical protein
MSASGRAANPTRTPAQAASFPKSRWNLLLDWKIGYRRELTHNASILLDAIGRLLLGYNSPQGELGQHLLREVTGIDGRNFGRAQGLLESLGLTIEPRGKGRTARTFYDLAPILTEACSWPIQHGHNHRPNDRRRAVIEEGHDSHLNDRRRAVIRMTVVERARKERDFVSLDEGSLRDRGDRSEEEGERVGVDTPPVTDSTTPDRQEPNAPQTPKTLGELAAAEGFEL